MLPAFAADTAGHIRGVSSVLEVVPTGCRQGASSAADHSRSTLASRELHNPDAEGLIEDTLVSAVARVDYQPGVGWASGGKGSRKTLRLRSMMSVRPVRK
jgi:hypothetical protein